MSCSSSDPPGYCSTASPELKLYQAFIFSVPVFFTLVLLIVFYLFYLRRRRANWQSLRMRASQLSRGGMPRNSETGIKKEVREMLPVVVFKESFLIRETQCAVCLGEYQSDERLQRIPPCGHTFHVDCIDHWLTTNTTCPLCRVSLLPAAKCTNNESLQLESVAVELENMEEESSERLNNDAAVHQNNNAAAGQRHCSGEAETIRNEAEGSTRVDIDIPVDPVT